MNTIAGIKKILLLGSVVALSACTKTDYFSLSKSKYYPNSSILKSKTLERAKSSKIKTQPGETLIKICADQNVNVDQPSWYCHEMIVFNGSEQLMQKELIHHFEKSIGFYPIVSESVFSEGIVKYEAKVFTNNKELEFIFISIVDLENEWGIFGGEELPIIMECKGKISYIAPSAEGYTSEYCFYEYSKNI